MTDRRKPLSSEGVRLKHVRARRKFKGAVHLVMANLYWLQDIGEDEELGEDVKKNIAMLMKKKKDKKSLLSFKDKAILCKPPDERTDEEKLHLFRIIGNLKCFRKYRTDVKMKLAAACLFLYYPPNRVIVKQFRPGHSLYFIMSGEVSVSITEFDPILNEYKTNVVGTMETGQMFGEVSLLHDIPRTATITTISHCELIVLEKTDFNKVLKSTLQAVWDEILAAMSRFRYFDGWDEVSMRECCIYSRITQYRKNDVVYGNGGQSDNYVHFILKGQCRMIEELPVVEAKIHGVKSYELFDREEYKKQVKSRRQSIRSAGDRKQSMAAPKPSVTNGQIKITPSLTRTSGSSKARRSTVQFHLKEEFHIVEEETQEEEVKKGQKEGVAELKKLLGIYEEVEEEIPVPTYVKIIFMQVCFFNELACFGFGERIRYRKIVAVTDYVNCLLIPRFWIWQKNKANVWTRVVHTLNNKIPRTQKIFDIFLENRRWGKWKRELINSTFKKPKCNVMNNVPYSIRLTQDIDYGVTYKAV